MGAEVAFLGILDTTYSGSVRNLNSWVPSGLVIHISKDSDNFHGSSVHISLSSGISFPVPLGGPSSNAVSRITC